MRDSAASIADTQFDYLVADASGDLDSAIGRGMTDRVGDEVLNHPTQLLRVGVDHGPRFGVAPQSDSAGPSHGSANCYHFADGVGEWDRFDRELKGFCVNPGEFKQVVDHSSHSVDGLAHLGVIARGVFCNTVLERLRHSPQAGKRSSQIVGNPGDQLTARSFESAFSLIGVGQPLRGVRELVGDSGEFRRGSVGSDKHSGRTECARCLLKLGGGPHSKARREQREAK